MYFPQVGMKYWDAFEERVAETISALREDRLPPLRRLSVHITQRCNSACAYCNERLKKNTLDKNLAFGMLRQFSDMGGGIVHVTGGEPTTVEYLNDFALLANSLPGIKFHLNTNLFSVQDVLPAVLSTERLKVSLDTADGSQFCQLVGVPRAFDRVVNNLDLVHKAIVGGRSKTVVSLTCTLTRQNYKGIPDLLKMYYRKWPKFYAMFFSAYKGTNPEFAFSSEDIVCLFQEIVPQLEALTKENNDAETRLLFQASHDETTFVQGCRFPKNGMRPCYVQLSELLVDSHGDLYNCSHLFRDGQSAGTGLNLADGRFSDLFRQSKAQISCYPLSLHCLYGCNKKLVQFNSVVWEEMSKQCV
jgi:MoaA/NifB/PqqE/SkfB family radical SAM enzyme